MSIALDIISLFPEMFSALTEQGVVSRAFKSKLVDVAYWNPRDFVLNRYKKIDDKSYGGGPGMVMMAPPLAAAIRAAKSRQNELDVIPYVIYLSPQGNILTQLWAQNMVKKVQSSDLRQYGLVLVCGRYEAIDERLFQLGLIDEEVSIGDVVVSGGELPAMLMLDALFRLIPGVLNDEQSAQQDSFSHGLLDCPHYTKPEIFEGIAVPDVLLSGNHAKIEKFRRQQQLLVTYYKRPDLIKVVCDKKQLTHADSLFLQGLK